jgi:MFS family permease
MRSRGLAVGAAGIAVTLGALDAYVVVGVLTDMVRDMGIPVNHLERATPIVTGYLLGYVVAMPLLGQLSDRFGRRPVLQLCLLAFAVGSVLTALADTVAALVGGRLLQGAAGGALLPVTMALVGDLWAQERRSAALGAVGAAQELGSVVGTMYGVALAGLLNSWRFFENLEPQSWRWIFWVNLPLTLLTMVLIQLTVPPRSSRSRPLGRIDLVGAALLAVALGLLIAGLYNPDPEHAVLPQWGIPCIGAALVILLGFGWWERRSPVRLVNPTHGKKGAFLAILGVGLVSGSALMVTLVDVELFAQTLLGKDSGSATLLLVPFLLALPVGAVVGGWGVGRYGERLVACAGMLIATTGYLLISRWPVDVLSARHPAGLPVLPTDLIIAGLGLGLVIAPLSAAMLRVVPAAQHGIGSAVVVIARMTGMLVGIAALTAWGLHRFRVLTATLDTPLPFGTPKELYEAKLARYQLDLAAALHSEYAEIFLITTVLCLAGAGLCLLLPSRAERLQPVPIDL